MYIECNERQNKTRKYLSNKLIKSVIVQSQLIIMSGQFHCGNTIFDKMFGFIVMLRSITDQDITRRISRSALQMTLTVYHQLEDFRCSVCVIESHITCIMSGQLL